MSRYYLSLIIPILFLGIFHFSYGAVIFERNIGNITGDTARTNYYLTLGKQTALNDIGSIFFEVLDEAGINGWENFEISQCETPNYTLPCKYTWIAYNNASFSNYYSVNAFGDNSRHWVEGIFDYYKYSSNNQVSFSNKRASTTPINLDPNLYTFVYFQEIGANNNFYVYGVATELSDIYGNPITCSSNGINNNDCTPLKTLNFAITDTLGGFAEQGLIFQSATSTGEGLTFASVPEYCDQQFGRDGLIDFGYWSCRVLGVFFIPSTDAVSKFTGLPGFIFQQAPFSLWNDGATLYDELFSTTTATSTLSATTTISYNNINLPINFYVDLQNYVNNNPQIKTFRDWSGRLMYLTTGIIATIFLTTII